MKQKTSKIKSLKEVATYCHDTAREMQMNGDKNLPARIQHACMVKTTGAVLKFINRLEKMSQNKHTR